MATKVIYAIPNIHCEHCVHTIQSELSELEGVKSAKANLTLKNANIEFEAPASEEEALWKVNINFPSVP